MAAVERIAVPAMAPGDRVSGRFGGESISEGEYLVRYGAGGNS